jgi:hypothetical protein
MSKSNNTCQSYLSKSDKLLVVVHTWMEGIDIVLNRRADIDADELAAIVAALRDIKWEEAQQHVERVSGWLRRFKAEPLTDATPILQPQRKQPRPARR